MDVSGMFSDDQMAVIYCFGAMAVCCMIAALSFHFGPAGRQQTPMDVAQNRTLPLQKRPDPGQHKDRRAA